METSFAVETLCHQPAEVRLATWNAAGDGTIMTVLAGVRQVSAEWACWADVEFKQWLRARKGGERLCVFGGTDTEIQFVIDHLSGKVIRRSTVSYC